MGKSTINPPPAMEPSPKRVSSNKSSISSAPTGKRSKPDTKCRDSPFGKLPSIQGVNKLTRSEIRRDIDEIEALLVGVTDLDGIKILPSYYPVKPRLELKVPEHIRAAQRAAAAQAQQVAVEREREGDIPFAELLEFLRLAEVVRPDILDAEREREQLEAKYLAIRDNFVAESLRQNENNKKRYNFIRALQALLGRSICEYSVSGHHVSMLSDVLHVIEAKSEACARLGDALATLKAIRSTTDETGSSVKLHVPNVAAAVAVKTQSGIHYLYSGMQLDTPFGAGAIKRIRLSGIKSVEVQLPYGLLYTSPAEAICWFSHVNDSSFTDDNKSKGFSNKENYLVHRWEGGRRGLFLPLDVQRDIIANSQVGIRISSSAAAEPKQRNKRYGRKDFISTTLDVNVSPLEAMKVHVGMEANEDQECGESATDYDDSEDDGDEKENYLKPLCSSNGLLDMKARASIEACLPFLFAPPEMIPEVVQRVDATRNCKIVWPHAMNNSIPTKVVEALRAKLDLLQSEISCLNSEKLNYVNEVSLSGAKGALLTQQSALTRLAMFTRRVRRRQLAAEPSGLDSGISESLITNGALAEPAELKRPNKSNPPTPQKAAPNHSGAELLHDVSPAGSQASAGGKSRALRGAVMGAQIGDKIDAGVSTSRSSKRKAPSSVVEDSEVLESSQRSELSVDGEGMAPPGAAGSTSNRSKRSRKS